MGREKERECGTWGPRQDLETKARAHTHARGTALPWLCGRRRECGLFMSSSSMAFNCRERAMYIHIHSFHSFGLGVMFDAALFWACKLIKHGETESLGCHPVLPTG